MRSLVVWVSLLVAAVGCNSGSSTETPNPSPTKVARAAPAEAWALVAIDPNASVPAFHTNGRIGLRISRNGDAFGPDGNQLLYLHSDRIEPDGEEKIRAQRHPLDRTLLVRVANRRPVSINFGRSEDYEQRLDLRSGRLTTRGTVEVEGVRIRCEFVIALSPSGGVLAQTWRCQPDQACVIALSNSDAIALSEPKIYENVFRNGTQMGPEKLEFEVRANESNVVGRVVSLDGPIESSITPERVFTASETFWREMWETDIEIEGPVEDQQAIRSWLFYLQASIDRQPSNKQSKSVAPMGLSSTVYFGHVFWDADLWVYPALALVDPAGATEIPGYRLRMADQARKNFREWVAADRPVAGRKLGTARPTRPGIKFPWESSVTGKETVPGPSQYQHHITGTVAFSLNLARILGQADPLESQRILREADGFYEARSEPGIDGLRHIRDTMSPDENHIGDDDLYTNLLATWSSHNGRWKPSPSPYALPQDDKSFLTYQKDAQKGYKQAAAVLAIYPLQFPAAESQARVMMDRFADKVSKNGPAMSDSVHALIWARLGERERAYETWQSSWKDFHFPPHGLFSEKRRSDRTVFLTGMGGCLQTVIYGLLGFRIDSKPLPDAVWSQKLIGENWLSVKPNLPPAWKRVTFRNFAVLGQKRTLVATASGATVTPE